MPVPPLSRLWKPAIPRRPRQNPRRTERILKATAEDTPCPSPPGLVYPDPDLEGLTNTCEGTLERNGFYGFGVVDAMSAVIRL